MRRLNFTVPQLTADLHEYGPPGHRSVAIYLYPAFVCCTPGGASAAQTGMAHGLSGLVETYDFEFTATRARASLGASDS